MLNYQKPVLMESITEYETPLAKMIRLTNEIDLHELHDYEDHIDHHQVN